MTSTRDRSADGSSVFVISSAERWPARSESPPSVRASVASRVEAASGPVRRTAMCSGTSSTKAYALSDSNASSSRFTEHPRIPLRFTMNEKTGRTSPRGGISTDCCATLAPSAYRLTTDSRTRSSPVLLIRGRNRIGFLSVRILVRSSPPVTPVFSCRKGGEEQRKTFVRGSGAGPGGVPPGICDAADCGETSCVACPSPTKITSRFASDVEARRGLSEARASPRGTLIGDGVILPSSSRADSGVLVEGRGFPVRSSESGTR